MACNIYSTEDSVSDQIKLTLFTKLEESITVENDPAVENKASENNHKEERKSITEVDAEIFVPERNDTATTFKE